MMEFMDIRVKNEWENETFKSLQVSEAALINISFEECNFIDCELNIMPLQSPSFYE